MGWCKQVGKNVIDIWVSSLSYLLFKGVNFVLEGVNLNLRMVSLCVFKRISYLFHGVGYSVSTENNQDALKQGEKDNRKRGTRRREQGHVVSKEDHKNLKERKT